MNRAEQIKIIPIKEIIPNAKNRNNHPPEQIERLKKIINYQGFRVPVIISNQTGKLVAGHGRLLAAKALGLETVPAIYQDFENEEQEYAAGISDNSVAAWAELDLSGINTDIGDLGPDFDIDLLGIEDFVIEPADKLGNCDEDEVPSVGKAYVQLGDLFFMGSHRLVCGDSTDSAQVTRLMNGEKADMVFTDPPFNVGYEYNEHDDSASHEEYEKLLLSILAQGKVLMLNGWSNIPVICKLRKPTHIGCWYKSNSATPSAVAHLSKWQPIFFFGKFSRNRPDDFFDFHVNSGFLRDPDAGIHSCPLPFKLVEELLKCYGEKTIYEPFCGSGTTLIACEKTNRKCFGMEIDPIYCGVILDRWAKFTGLDPQREDGTPWSIIKSNG